MSRVVPAKQDTITATIANGAAISGATSLNSGWPVGVIIPAAWTTADISFDVSADGGANYSPLYDKDGEVTIPSAQVVAVRYIALDPTKFHGVTDLKIRSGLNGSTTNQGGARVITLVRSYR